MKHILNLVVIFIFCTTALFSQSSTKRYQYYINIPVDTVANEDQLIANKLKKIFKLRRCSYDYEKGFFLLKTREFFYTNEMEEKLDNSKIKFIGSITREEIISVNSNNSNL